MRKILLVLVLILLLAFVGSCGGDNIGEIESQVNGNELSVPISYPQSEMSTNRHKLPETYNEIIADFRNLVLARIDFENFDAQDTKWDSVRGWWSHEIFHNGSEVSGSNFGFALIDLNNSGNDALVLLLDDYTILAIFSEFDGAPRLLDSFYQRYKAAIAYGGLIHIFASGGAAVWEYDLKILSQNGSELVTTERYVSNFYEQFREINGERFEMIDEARERYRLLTGFTANEINTTSLTFIPLFE